MTTRVMRLIEDDQVPVSLCDPIAVTARELVARDHVGLIHPRVCPRMLLFQIPQVRSVVIDEYLVELCLKLEDPLSQQTRGYENEDAPHDVSGTEFLENEPGFDRLP